MAWRKWHLVMQAKDSVQMMEFITQEEVGNNCLESAIAMKQRESRAAKDQSAKLIEAEDANLKI